MAFQFKIQLSGISKPPVWRKVIVTETITFEQFHETIQVAFGWLNYHLYQFSEKGYGSPEVIGVPSDEDDFMGYKTVDSSKVKLNQVFKAVGQKLLYNYDFGDDWEHRITLEAITDEAATTPRLLKAKGTCPPEDCGGPWGYENLKAVLDGPNNAEKKELKKWLGMSQRAIWDPNEVDVDDINEELRNL